MALGDHTHLDMAKEAAAFIRRTLYRDESGVLIRNAYRDGSSGCVCVCVCVCVKGVAGGGYELVFNLMILTKITKSANFQLKLSL